MKTDESILARTVARCRERGVILPTFAQLDDPSRMPAHLCERLREVGMQDLDPVNLFRITWRNEPVDYGGLFNDGNFLELPPALTGVEARIVGLVGKWFPTGAHKVGAGFGCLIPPLVTGAFDPTAHKAVWPSTGNFCRGGAFDCALLGCDAVAILPEEMSPERFAWLREIGAEIIATPGGESNVKEIYDACKEIRKTRRDCVIFNQFEAFGNAVWHYHVTGPALRRAFDAVSAHDAGARCAAFVSATGSAGTIAAGDYLKRVHPSVKITAAEALQCPTLLRCGHGDHAIEGIGDKHVPWIHNVRATDLVCAIDDRACLALLRLFNEPAGREVLRRHGVDAQTVASLGLLGISSICNALAAIKTARHFELGPRDVVLTVFTDSTDLYRSRLEGMRVAHGPYDERTAWRHLGCWLEGVATDHMRELDHWGRRALHDLKYFTWVEQQGRTAEELDRLWEPEHWERAYAQVETWDRLIDAFNERVLAVPAVRDAAMKVTVNGVEHDYRGDESRWLLDWLRRDLHILSPKDGCSPQAACGCCAVALNDKVVLACATPMKKAAGGAVRTLEGLSERVRTAFADAFAACGGAQCAFCIPGMVMRSACLLESERAPSRDAIEHELRFHLCRCTGYKKIVDSVCCAADALRNGGRVAAPAGASGGGGGGIGTRLPKYDIRRAVLGERQYVADMSVPGMRHGAVRLSDHPRARVVAIDASAARAMTGVDRVFLAADVPGRRSVGLIVPDWPVLVAEGEITRCVGDVLAFVVAADRATARAAAEAVKVEYEVLDPVTDVDAALAPGAPAIHSSGNCLSTTIVRKGDVDRAFAECAFVVDETYHTQRIEHAYLEPEAALALPEGGGVRVYSQGQGVYEDRRQIAQILGLDEKRVRVDFVPNGGAFGGKEDLCVQGHAAIAALLLGLPVHVELSRDESILMHPKRHPMRLHYRLGCTKDGRLLALRARIVGDKGAYASVGMKVLERAAGHATGAYDVPNVDIESRAVYTNNVPCGAMRGFGANQAAFAMECAVDELCAMGGFDRWQLRWDNALTEGGRTATGQRLSTGVGVRATLEAVRDVFRSAKHAGIACGIKNTGIGNGMPDAGTAAIVVRGANDVEIHHGWTDMGQGVDTMAVQTFCAETGLPPEIVRVRVSTADETPCGMTTASRATSLVGNALILACAKLNADLKVTSLAGLAGRTYRGEWVCDWTNKPGHAHGGEEITHYSYSYATQVVILDDAGAIARVVAAHDAGRVINPTLFEGQIEGSVHMGLGYALTEDLPMEGGYVKSTRLRHCGVLRAAETPPIDVIAVEVPDEFGPYGAKGVGEIGLVPTAPAVANALWSFDGVRRRSLPMMRKARP